jgi:hypothetical protein
MRLGGTVVIALCCLLVTGCHGVFGGRPREQRQRDVDRALMLQQQQAEQAALFLKSYEGIGVVEVRVTPAGASLWIDGGEYLDARDQIRLPVGPHEFKAVWPGEREAKRAVYVGQVQVSLTMKSDFESREHGVSFALQPRDLDVQKTIVVLPRPVQ